MQQKLLHRKFNYVRDLDTTEYSQTVYERKDILQKIKLLLAEGCSEETALEVNNISRATYYRWKKSYTLFGLAGLENESRRPNNVRKPARTAEEEKRVYHLRITYKLWGKAKIAACYKTEYKKTISESTVGRIISKLVEQNKIMPVRFLYGKKDLRRRVFSGHAQRWKRDMKSTQPGELIQVDHMTLSVPGFGELKHFNAICPTSKYAVFKAYKEANSRNAADFLEHLKEQFPVPIISLQVDGGSEFMGEFEKACFESNIPLFVLPPRKPKFNANVERGNGTAKYEFYYQYDQEPSFHMIQKNLQRFAHFYNKKRPHQGIDLLTPSQFFEVMGIRA